MTKAVFFDVDGTLLDTTEYIYKAFEHSLNHYKHPLVSREIMQLSVGKPLEECYQDFTKLEKVVNLMDRHKEFQRHNVELVKAYPHTVSTLEHLRSKGMSIAAITSRSKESTIKSLQYAEVYPLIDYFVALEDVVTPKPDPEGILKAMNFFSVKPDEIMMVGDSPVDVEAGRNAKARTVGASYGFHGERIRESQPDVVIQDIYEVLSLIV